MVVVVTNVDAYLFLTFLALTCYLEDTGIGVLWLHHAVFDSKETELAISN